jgi:hypothetical protein
VGRPISQVAFSAGELAPSLYARADLARYAMGARQLTNWLIQPQGGVKNRPGTKLVAEVKDSTKTVRLVAWDFGTEANTYVLELGDQYLRIHYQGGVVTDSGTGLPIEVVTPYLEAELSSIDVNQSADVMILCHPNHAPRQLARTSHTSWTLSTISFTPATNTPAGVTVTPDDATDQREWEWVVTAVHDETGEESLGSSPIANDCTLSATSPATVSWGAVTGCSFFNVYRGLNGVHGYIGSSRSRLTFRDLDYDPVYTDTPPLAANPFAATGDYPACSAFYQGRLLFAGSDNHPQTIHGSQSGNFFSFYASIPPRESDALELTIASRKVSRILALVPLQRLLALTAGAEWAIGGGDTELLTPSSVSARVQSEFGAAQLAPLVIGDTALYVVRGASTVRELGYSWEADAWGGSDLGVMSAHLFEGYSLTAWAYASRPHSIVYAVRSDGTLLALTYMREHQVAGWTRLTTDGAFESAAVVPEGTESAIYVVVRRTVNGATKRFVERFTSRQVADIVDAVFVDSAVSYDGRNTTAETMECQGGTTYARDTECDVVSSAASFDAGDVGIQLHLTDSDQLYRLLVLSRLSASKVRCRILRDLPAALQNTPTTTWARAPMRFTGLDHLEGRTVGVLADGHVHAPVAVSAGSIELQHHAAVVHAGLSYTSTLETLDVSAGGDPLRGLRLQVPRVWVQVTDSRGIWAGPDISHLSEAKAEHPDNYDDPIALVTDVSEIPISGTWREGGRVVVQQSDPLPLSVLGVSPDVVPGA